jgi:hypothetical protein
MISVSDKNRLYGLTAHLTKALDYRAIGPRHCDDGGAGATAITSRIDPLDLKNDWYLPLSQYAAPMPIGRT